MSLVKYNQWNFWTSAISRFSKTKYTIIHSLIDDATQWSIYFQNHKVTILNNVKVAWENIFSQKFGHLWFKFLIHSITAECVRTTLCLCFRYVTGVFFIFFFFVLFFSPIRSNLELEVFQLFGQNCEHDLAYDLKCVFVCLTEKMEIFRIG